MRRLLGSKSDIAGIEIRKGVGIRNMLDTGLMAIKIQINKLEVIDGSLCEKEKRMFEKVVTSLRTSNFQKAEIIANELVEMRKMKKMVTSARLALSQVALRVSTIRELGDVTVTLSSAVAAVHGVKNGIANIVPEAEKSLEEITGTLSNTLIDVGQTGGLTVDFKTANIEAEKILNEASEVAERKLKEEFPELPADLTEQIVEPLEA